jgi:hypothetical protein
MEREVVDCAAPQNKTCNKQEGIERGRAHNAISSWIVLYLEELCTKDKAFVLYKLCHRRNMSTAI